MKWLLSRKDANIIANCQQKHRQNYHFGIAEADSVETLQGVRKPLYIFRYFQSYYKDPVLTSNINQFTENVFVFQNRQTADKNV